MAASERVQQLESLLKNNPNDSFLLYGLAMEVLKEDEADGMARLKALIALDRDYQAAHFQLAQTLVRRGEVDEAKDWLDQGIAAARRIGNQHAAEEMTGFRDSL